VALRLVWTGLLAGLGLLGCSAAASSPPPRTYSGDQAAVGLTPAPGLAGDPANGRRLFLAAGCGGCHTLRGLAGASGVAGPNVTNVVLRPTLAGPSIAMTPDTLTAWLLDPATLEPNSTMPAVGLSQQEARDITAFLYSQPYNPAP
jgi:cytochrome c1